MQPKRIRTDRVRVVERDYRQTNLQRILTRERQKSLAKYDFSDLPGEVWLPVPGWDSFYLVSDLGRVKRIGYNKGAVVGRILKTDRGNVARGSYPSADLRRPGRLRRVFVHVLVAAAFLGPKPPGMECNHIDGDHGNSHITNIEYVTAQRNIVHSFEIGHRTTHKNPVLVGAANPMSKLTDDERREIQAAPHYRELLTDFSAKYGVSRSQIHRIRQATKSRIPRD